VCGPFAAERSKLTGDRDDRPAVWRTRAMDSALGLSGGRARADEGHRRLVVGAWSRSAQSTTPWAKDPDPIYIIIIVYTKYVYIYGGIIRYQYIATIIITHVYNIIYRRDIYVPYEFFSFSFPRVLPTGRRRKYYYYYYCLHYILYTYYMYIYHICGYTFIIYYYIQLNFHKTKSHGEQKKFVIYR